MTPEVEMRRTRKRKASALETGDGPADLSEPVCYLQRAVEKMRLLNQNGQGTPPCWLFFDANGPHSCFSRVDSAWSPSINSGWLVCHADVSRRFVSLRVARFSNQGIWLRREPRRESIATW